MDEFTISAEEMLSLLKIIETIMMKLNITQEDVDVYTDDDIPNFYCLINEVNICVKLKEES
jgi:hypothetical protein